MICSRGTPKKRSTAELILRNIPDTSFTHTMSGMLSTNASRYESPGSPGDNGGAEMVCVLMIRLRLGPTAATS